MTSRRTNRVATYLTDEEMSQFEQWAAESDKPYSHLLRDAILEYLDNDRAARLADRLDRIEAKLDTLDQSPSEPTTHTHKHDTVTKASETVAKTREIADRLQSNYDCSAHVDEVERAIKDIAGGDPRTIRKYKQELKERGHVYEHPNDDSPVWYTDRGQFDNAVRDYARQTPDPAGTAKKLYDEHGIDAPDDLVAELEVTA